MNKKRESLYWYWLYNIEGIGPKIRQKLLAIYQTPLELFEHLKEEDLRLLSIPSKTIQNLVQNRDIERIQKSYDMLEKRGIRVVTYADEEYPKRLMHIYDAPGVLYVKGQLPDEDCPTIAIVGARDCTNYGKEIATYFARHLSEAGVQIVSGLARGVDRYAHEGAVNYLGGTYAVLGCGIDICYPRENINLYMEIEKQGGILSEYPPGYQPLQGNFPMRNRIISGLADGILLVEARKKSGSLITMDYGLDQGKNIYACPGRITDSLSYGTNHIIQLGGKLVLEPRDILEDFGIDAVRQSHEEPDLSLLTTDERSIYELLSLMPKHVEEILNESHKKVGQVTQLLLQLQLKGFVKEISGNYYSKTYRVE